MTFPTKADAEAFLARFRKMADTTAIAMPTTHGHWVITSPSAVKREPRVCSICGETFREFANNAQPINDGQCCAYCDDHEVTPARIAMAHTIKWEHSA